MVSVIIPAYNAEKYIKRAIQSIIDQTYKNIEIVVIDDGSTDSTGKIAEGFSQYDTRVHVIHVNNGGEAKSRNIGLNNTNGDYIAFCDADDYMHPTFIEKMMSCIINNDADMAVCAWRNVDESGHELMWKKSELKTKVLSKDRAQVEFLTTGNIEGFCWNKVISKKLYVSTSINYDVRRLSFCDVLANFKLLCASDKVACLGERLYDYYQIDTACTHVANIRKNYDYMEMIDEIYEVAVSYGLETEALIYATNRLIKFLYGMIKNKDSFNKRELDKYFISAYDKHLRMPFGKKFKYAWGYPLENPIKFGLKIIMVDYYRHRLEK